MLLNVVLGQLIYLVSFHNCIALKVGRLLHVFAHQQHGVSFNLNSLGVCEGLVIRKTLLHTFLEHYQSLMHITL